MEEDGNEGYSFFKVGIFVLKFFLRSRGRGFCLKFKGLRGKVDFSRFLGFLGLEWRLFFIYSRSRCFFRRCYRIGLLCFVSVSVVFVGSRSSSIR